MLLLCKAWREEPPGSIPNDDAVLARWARITPDRWTECRTRVLAPFTLGPDSRWHQKRLRLEYQKFATRRRAASEAGQSAALQKWKKEKSDNGHQTRSQRLIAARKLGTHTEAEWYQLLAFCEGKCVRCGATDSLVKDHIKPIYQGGSDSILNLQPLCATCNRSKGPENKDYRPSDTVERLRNVCETSASVCLPSSYSFPITEKKKQESAFATFWDAYPKKLGMNRARECWISCGCETRLGEVLASLNSWKATEQWKDVQYIPYPARWLSDGLWKENPRPQKPEVSNLVAQKRELERKLGIA